MGVGKREMKTEDMGVAIVISQPISPIGPRKVISWPILLVGDENYRRPNVLIFLFWPICQTLGVEIIFRGSFVRFSASKIRFRGPNIYCGTLGVGIIFRGSCVWFLGVKNTISWPK